MEFEQARLGMEELLTWAKANAYDLKRNEADTRLQLIDRLLFDCLDWRREDCHSEEHWQSRLR